MDCKMLLINGRKKKMLYGFIYRLNNGIIELHINNYPYRKYIFYTLYQAKQQYRKEFNLKYKKITWL